MGACAETRQYSRGNDHRIDRVCVLRAFLASGPGFAGASARQEMSRIRDFVAAATAKALRMGGGTAKIRACDSRARRFPGLIA